MENKNMTITIESGYGQKYTAEICRDSNSNDLFETFVQLAKSLGYHPSSIIRSLQAAAEDEIEIAKSVAEEFGSKEI